MERSEDRSVPAVFATVDAKTLLVTGSATTPGSEIRIDGAGEQVRVFDGATLVATFKEVTSIDARPASGSNLGVDLGPDKSFSELSVRLGKGVNTVRLGAGQVKAATISGMHGADAVSVKGLSVANLYFDGGLGNDKLTINQADIAILFVNETEQVDLAAGTVATIVDVQHRTDAVKLSTAAVIRGGLQLQSAGGTLNLGGSVAGDVAFISLRFPANSAQLAVTGNVGGSLSMTGTRFNDSATFEPTSRVSNRLSLDLGAGDDNATFAGVVGGRKTSALRANLGAGSDTFTITGSAKWFAATAQVLMGDGDDVANISKSAYIQWLDLDGGAGRDTLHGTLAKPFGSIAGFEIN